MINRILIASSLHAGLSLAGYVGLNAWAMGFLDGGGAEPGAAFAAVRIVVGFVLLQPLAYWILVVDRLVWWTWPGLGLAAIVVLANSFLQIGLAVSLWRALRPRARARRRPGDME